ncbi:MAG: hypothetical protein ACJ758_09630 [Actinomycetota bacterium]
MAKKRKRRPRTEPAQAGAGRPPERSAAGATDGGRGKAAEERPRPRPDGARGGGAAPAGQGGARSARKEEARQQRDRIRRKVSRRRRTRQAGIALAVVALVAVVAFLVFNNNQTSTPKAQPGQLTGLNDGPPPWPVEINGLYQRLQAIGLPPQAVEGQGLHSDQHLDIYVDGQPIQIPQGVGIPPGYKADPGTTPTDFISILHTHDTSGIVHVEAPSVTQYTLGEFFDVWGVKFTPQCLGNLCETKDKTIEVFVNGKLQTGDPTKVSFSLEPLSQEIVLAYGTKAELPNPIPSQIPNA